MNIIPAYHRLADPSNRRATRAERQYNDKLARQEDFNVEALLDIKKLLAWTAGTALLATPILILIFWGPWYAKALCTVAAIGVVAWLLWLSGPSINYRYQKHHRSGGIIEVPKTLMAAWNTAANKVPGFTTWHEYEQRRFDALSTLLLVTSHLTVQLNQCGCGSPDSCTSIRHLTDEQFSLAHETLESLVAVELRNHTDALQAQQQAAAELR